MMGGVASWTYGDDDSESGDAESGSEGGPEDASEDEASPEKTSMVKGRAALKPGVVQGTGRRAAKSDRTMDIDDEEEDG